MVRRLILGGVPLLALVAYLTLAVAMFSSTWVRPTTALIGVGPDPVMFTWFLRWTPYAVMHGINPLFTTFLDFPSGVNLTWNTWVPLIGIGLAPITIWGGPVLAYNVAATLCPALSAWTAFLMLRRFLASPAAPAVGGLLYGFSPYIQAQALGHLHLTAAFIPPLLLMTLHTILVRQDRSWMRMGLALGLLAALQLLTSEEMLASEAVIALPAIALLAAMSPVAIRDKLPYAVRAGTTAAATALALTAYPLAMQFFGPQHVAGPLQPPNIFVSDLFSFVLPTGAQLLAPAPLEQLTMRFSGNPAEWGSYLGLPLLALLGVAAWRNWGDAVVRFSARLGVLLALLSLGLTIHLLGYASAVPAVLLGLPWPAIDHRGPGRVMLYGFIAGWAGLARLPVASDILPARLMLYVYLLAAVLVAVAIERWLITGTGRLERWGGGALIAVSLIALTPRLPFPSTPASIPAFFLGPVHQAVPPGSVVLVGPYADGAHPDAMLWQAASGMAFRMPQGYALIPNTRFDPPPSAMADRMALIENGSPTPAMTDQIRHQLLEELSGWKVTWVVVGPMPHHAEMAAFFTDLLGQPPQVADGVDLFRVS